MGYYSAFIKIDKLNMNVYADSDTCNANNVHKKALGVTVREPRQMLIVKKEGFLVYVDMITFIILRRAIIYSSISTKCKRPFHVGVCLE